MNKIDVKNKKVNEEKLLSFGFEKQNDSYIYMVDLMNHQMKMIVTISKDLNLFTAVIDNSSNEEYVLHLIPNAVGSYVGQIRSEYEEVLDNIIKNCFEPDVFKSIQALNIIGYIRDKYGDELEFLWEKFPHNAIWRRKDNKKWYAALLTVSKRKLGVDSNEIIEIIDLRMRTEDIDTIVDDIKYFRGYHMNKKHWITICLDNTVPDKEIQQRIDDSYTLAIK